MTRGLPVSILLHLLVLGALATWGGLSPMQPIDPRHVLRVQLAELPEPPADPEPEPEPLAAESEPPPEATRPTPQPPEVELPPKEVPELETEPEAEVEPEPDPAPPPEVREPEPSDTPVEEPVDAPAPASEPSLTTDEVFPFDYYLRTVRNNIARKWQPKQLGFRGQSQRSCVIHFVIGRAGQVSQVTLVRSSGLSLFDREALRAVNASRMPPLPAKFASPSLGVTFTFTLQSGV